MAAIIVVYLVRAPKVRPVPARVLLGDSVSTIDGLDGTVTRLDGAFALVDAGVGQLAWARTADLMRGTGAPSMPGASSGAATAPPAPPVETPDSGSALHRFAEGVWEARTTIAWGWLVAVLACLPLAATAEQSFSNGGFLIKDGEAIQVIQEVQDDFQMPVGQQVMIVPGPIHVATQRVKSITPELYRIRHVLVVGTPRASKDGRLVAVTIYFDSPDDNSIAAFEPLKERFAAAGFPEDEIQVAGSTALYADTNTQTKRDLVKAESIGAPLALLVLLFVFGTVVAALVPLAVGIASVILTLAILHLLSIPLGLSVFVMNIATMLGFGLGIDYSLLGVSRFREELARGRSVQQAVVTTITTSGRAAAISGVAVLAGIAALAAIPLPVMFAIALGGVVVVAVTVLASLTMLPAVLGLLGHRVERWRVRRERPAPDTTANGWYRLTHAVMRRPGLAIFGGIALLLLLAAPALTARLDVPHDEVLASDAPSLVARDTLQERFGEKVEAPVVLVVDSASDADITTVTAALLEVDHIRRVEIVKRDRSRDRTLVNAYGDAAMGAGGAVSRAVAVDVRELDLPVDILVSGQGAGEIEYLSVIRKHMPHTLILMFVSTFLILAVAFRSLTLPAKAIALDTLSILASLGAVVAVFQNGFGIELLGSEALGYTEATIPIILFCLLFGLSMDYEVFMLAKVTELYQAGHDDREATARGVAATAPLVTGAALILIVVGIAFAMTQLVLVKQIGFGMAVALALDATVVRILLLPATMRWLGPANWWMPEPLQRRVPRAEWAH
ncbi:MAG: family transporter [Thermoleophilia bacterium]|nr:family transporter [Thermoleophilia bacterium]